ncbi:hypothetical protein [Parabacteroides distasonis]|uniref:hypothetical protein n=1 Tax=Parabacteroides distasonis TaxID=823 RepID=UPI002164233C|nr:hypothetical protein [Parabacteroides distasonis]UVP73790.1 hypothetical protein NXW40_04455 [Parabacteroides distasonis]UVR12704.1 hypothetical protein NXW68_16370 [Parabacteroides distasonis]
MSTFLAASLTFYLNPYSYRILIPVGNGDVSITVFYLETITGAYAVGLGYLFFLIFSCGLAIADRLHSSNTKVSNTAGLNFTCVVFMIDMY